jgi:hypothetical protein
MKAPDEEGAETKVSTAPYGAPTIEISDAARPGSKGVSRNADDRTTITAAKTPA